MSFSTHITVNGKSFKSFASDKSFATKEDAWRWMYDVVDDSCTDNLRVAFHDDAASMEAYEIAINDGCCGSFDADVMINGRMASIGCNYGH